MVGSAAMVALVTKIGGGESGRRESERRSEERRGELNSTAMCQFSLLTSKVN